MRWQVTEWEIRNWSMSGWSWWVGTVDVRGTEEYGRWLNELKTQWRNTQHDQKQVRSPQEEGGEADSKAS